MANRTNYDNFKFVMETGRKAAQEQQKKIAKAKRLRKKSKEYQPKITKFDKPIPYEELEKHLNEK